MVLTNLYGRTHTQCTHIYQTEIITTMSHSPQVGLTKIIANSVDPDEAAHNELPHLIYIVCAPVLEFSI